MLLDQAIVYDIETYKTAFTFTAAELHGEKIISFEISPYRNQAKELWHFVEWCRANKIPMIGFNNLNFDHAVIHHWFGNPGMGAEAVYQYAQRVISDDRTLPRLWVNDRLAPQIDLTCSITLTTKPRRPVLKPFKSPCAWKT